MYSDNDDVNFEKFPSVSPENKTERQLSEQDDFEKAFANGNYPPFAGEQFGIAKESNNFYGESTDNQAEQDNQDNEGLESASALINYGIDAVAREIGVEETVQGIRSFDATGSENPIRDLYNHLGIDTEKEFNDVRDESEATKQFRERLRSEYNMPKTNERTREGAFKAIADMKELILDVEGADPRFNDLRMAAASAGKGYFEYAVQDYASRGLTELFSSLATQKASEQPPESQKEKSLEPQPEEQSEDQSELQPKDQSELESSSGEQIENKPETTPEATMTTSVEEETILTELPHEQDVKITQEDTEVMVAAPEGALFQAVTAKESQEQNNPNIIEFRKEKSPSNDSGQRKKVA